MFIAGGGGGGSTPIPFSTVLAAFSKVTGQAQQAKQVDQAAFEQFKLLAATTPKLQALIPMVAANGAAAMGALDTVMSTFRSQLDVLGQTQDVPGQKRQEVQQWLSLGEAWETFNEEIQSKLTKAAPSWVSESRNRYEATARKVSEGIEEIKRSIGTIQELANSVAEAHNQAYRGITMQLNIASGRALLAIASGSAGGIIPTWAATNGICDAVTTALQKSEHWFSPATAASYVAPAASACEQQIDGNRIALAEGVHIV